MIAGTAFQGLQDPPNVPHAPASTHVKPLHGTRQVWQLAKWLEVETLRFNETFCERALSSPALEFLLLATQSARKLHSKAFYELTKQVRQLTCWACMARHALRKLQPLQLLVEHNCCTCGI